jgi:hypothetical protein
MCFPFDCERHSRAPTMSLKRRDDVPEVPKRRTTQIHIVGRALIFRWMETKSCPCPTKCYGHLISALPLLEESNRCFSQGLKENVHTHFLEYAQLGHVATYAK